MDNNLHSQILNLIEKSKRILLFTHARADADGLGSMISAYLILKDLGKEVTAVTSDPTPENLNFLPAMGIVQNSLASSKDFIITLDCSKTPLNKIKYNLEDQRVNIIITPKQGVFTEKDVSFSQGENEKYDLIMVFDTGNLEHLGLVYDKNPNLFFETPLINVDHHASNTDFGQINLVDTVASATTEVLYHLLLEMEKRYNKKLVNEDIATLLLAGLITDTGSFQHSNTSPKAMEVAAQLMDLGARQQEIVKNIYKTKKLSTLKLWGIVLSKVQVDPVYRMVWSAVSQTDLRESGAISEETGSIIDDLLSNAPGAEVIFLIKDNGDGVISISMRSTTNQVDVGKLSATMGGGGHVRAAGFKVKDGRNFEQVLMEVVTKVREYQAKRLNIHPEDLAQAQPAAATVNGQRPKPAPVDKTAATNKPAPGTPKQETYLDFKVPEKKSAPTVKPAAPVTTVRTEKPRALISPTEETPSQKRRRRRKKAQASSISDNPPPVRPVAATPAKPPVNVPKPVPAPAAAPAPKPVVPAPQAPSIPAPVPAAVVATPAVPATPPSKPVVPTQAPTPAIPAIPPIPPVSSAPPAPSSPAPKPENSPDVPDWLKAE